MPVFTQYSEALKKNLSHDTLSTWDIQLANFLTTQKIPEKYSELEDLYHKTTEIEKHLIIGCILACLLINEKISCPRDTETIEEFLSEKAKKEGKEIVQLFEDNPEFASNVFVFDMLNALLQSPFFKIQIEHFLNKDPGLNQLIHYLKMCNEAWSVGNNKWYQEIDLYDEKKQEWIKLAEQLEKNYLESVAKQGKAMAICIVVEANKKLLQDLEKNNVAHNQFEQWRIGQIEKNVQKIVELMERKKSSLIVLNSVNCQDILRVLNKAEYLSGGL